MLLSLLGWLSRRNSLQYCRHHVKTQMRDQSKTHTRAHYRKYGNELSNDVWSGQTNYLTYGLTLKIILSSKTLLESWHIWDNLSPMSHRSYGHFITYAGKRPLWIGEKGKKVAFVHSRKSASHAVASRLVLVYNPFELQALVSGLCSAHLNLRHWGQRRKFPPVF